MIKRDILSIVINLIVLSVCAIECFGKNSYGKDGQSKDTPAKSEKLRICIVENRGTFRRTEQYCPLLEKQSNIECIVGVDRLDCARRIHKGYAHFGVFSSEDLVGARWASLEILVTSQIKFRKEESEYDVVVLVDNGANIHSAADLKNSRLCHPGKGLDPTWNDIIGDYMENVMVARGCEKDITLVESRIKATAGYFGNSCKAGPWVNDPAQDKILKSKYPSLCSLCFDKCTVGDKHWGRVGPLYCLASGAGEVAYVRLDDVRSFFGFTGLDRQGDPDRFSLLCPDSHLQPLNAEYPCSWVSKPWPVIAAKRSHAEQVQEMFRSIDTSSQWQQALLQLLESYHVNISSLDFPITIGDYLDLSSGYQSAHSFPACYPPRQIVYCTTTLIEFAKCSWLQEVSMVFGIEPNLQCIRGENLFRCLDDVARNVADVVLVDQDVRLSSERDFNLMPILYEFSSEFEMNYLTVAVVKSSSNIISLSDLAGRKACFPVYEGAAFVAATQALRSLKLISDNCTSTVKNFFHEQSCFGDTKSKHCRSDFVGERAAFHCLKGGGDVAFLNMDTFKNLTSKGSHHDASHYRVLCPFEKSRYLKGSDTCYLSWTSKGVLLTNQNKTQIRVNEIVNTLKTMDNHFGKQKFRSGNIPFTMFGPFDQKSNVLFKDATDSLKTKFEFNTVTNFERNLESFYDDVFEGNQHCSSHTESHHNQTAVLLLLAALLFVIFR